MRTTHRQIVVLTLCLGVAIAALVLLGWSGWVLSWLGGLFKMGSGATLMYFLSRYGFRLNLSELPPAQRSYAGISQAILVAGGAIAGALVS